MKVPPREGNSPVIFTKSRKIAFPLALLMPSVPPSGHGGQRGPHHPNPPKQPLSWPSWSTLSMKNPPQMPPKMTNPYKHPQKKTHLLASLRPPPRTTQGSRCRPPAAARGHEGRRWWDRPHPETPGRSSASSGEALGFLISARSVPRGGRFWEAGWPSARRANEERWGRGWEKEGGGGHVSPPSPCAGCSWGFLGASWWGNLGFWWNILGFWWDILDFWCDILVFCWDILGFVGTPLVFGGVSLVFGGTSLVLVEYPWFWWDVLNFWWDILVFWWGILSFWQDILSFGGTSLIFDGTSLLFSGASLFFGGTSFHEPLRDELGVPPSYLPSCCLMEWCHRRFSRSG